MSKKRKEPPAATLSAPKSSIKSFLCGGPPKSHGASQSSERCPCCHRPFPPGDVFESHVDHCVQEKVRLAESVNSKLAANVNSNAFVKLFAGAAAQKTVTCTFSLFLVNGLLSADFALPIPPEGDNLKQQRPFESVYDAGTIAWTEDANIRNFQYEWNRHGDCNANGPTDSDNVTQQRTSPPVRIRLVTNIASFQDTDIDNAVNQSKERIPTSLLKSMLQKAVRRRMGSKALLLALQLAKQAPNELLRRLPVICIEDAALHPAYAIIVWLMVAESKGYRPPPALMSLVCLWAAELAETPWRDHIPNSNSESESNQLQSQAQVIDGDDIATTKASPSALAQAVAADSATDGAQSRSFTITTGTKCSLRDLNHSPAATTLIAAMLVRASYGGMNCDVAMLHKYARGWHDRFLMPSLTTVSASKSLVALTLDHDSELSRSSGGTLAGYLDSRYMEDLCQSHWGQQCIQAFQVHDNRELATQNLEGACDHSATAGDAIGFLGCVKNQLLALSAQVSPAEFHPEVHPEVQVLVSAACCQRQSPAVTSSTSAALRVCCIQQLSAHLGSAAVSDLLVPEGLDFHVDWGLIKAVFSACAEELTQVFYRHYLPLMGDPMDQYNMDIQGAIEGKIKSAIWLFRSAINHHKIWSGVDQTSHEAEIKAELEEKKALAPIWRVIGGPLNRYCERKLREFN